MIVEINRENVREGVEESHGRGRPRKDNSRNKYCGVRLTEDEADMLLHLEIEFGSTPSETVRKALRMYYNYMIHRL